MAEIVKRSGTFKTNDPVAKIREIEKELYSKIDPRGKLFYYMPFYKPSETETGTYEYKFIALEVNDKDLWEQLVKKLEDLELKDQVNFVKKKSAEFSPNEGVSFDFSVKKRN